MLVFIGCLIIIKCVEFNTRDPGKKVVEAPKAEELQCHSHLEGLVRCERRLTPQPREMMDWSDNSLVTHQLLMWYAFSHQAWSWKVSFRLVLTALWLPQ